MTNKRLLIFITVRNSAMTMQEKINAALVLASFEHQVQLAFMPDSQFLLLKDCQAVTPFASVQAMLASAEYYDLPTFWLIDEGQKPFVDNTVHMQMSEIRLDDFDAVLHW